MFSSKATGKYKGNFSGPENYAYSFSLMLIDRLCEVLWILMTNLH
ncbi:hypothetical protein Tco_1366242, partial [Tanacetum coccineum]